LEETHHFLAGGGSIHAVQRKKGASNFNDLLKSVSMHPSEKSNNPTTDRQAKRAEVFSDGIGFLLKPHTNSATDSLEDTNSQQ